jgi:hypothetical protein
MIDVRGALPSDKLIVFSEIDGEEEDIGQQLHLLVNGIKLLFFVSDAKAK